MQLLVRRLARLQPRAAAPSAGTAPRAPTELGYRVVLSPGPRSGRRHQRRDRRGEHLRPKPGQRRLDPVDQLEAATPLVDRPRWRQTGRRQCPSRRPAGVGCGVGIEAAGDLERALGLLGRDDPRAHPQAVGPGEAQPAEAGEFEELVAQRPHRTASSAASSGPRSRTGVSAAPPCRSTNPISSDCASKTVTSQGSRLRCNGLVIGVELGAAIDQRLVQRALIRAGTTPAASARRRASQRSPAATRRRRADRGRDRPARPEPAGRAQPRSRRCFSATNSTLCPRATRVAMRLAMVWLLPVPGGPAITTDWPATAALMA